MTGGREEAKIFVYRIDYVHQTFICTYVYFDFNSNIVDKLFELNSRIFNLWRKKWKFGVQQV